MIESFWWLDRFDVIRSIWWFDPWLFSSLDLTEICDSCFIDKSEIGPNKVNVDSWVNGYRVKCGTFGRAVSLKTVTYCQQCILNLWLIASNVSETCDLLPAMYLKPLTYCQQYIWHLWLIASRVSETCDLLHAVYLKPVTYCQQCIWNICQQCIWNLWLIASNVSETCDLLPSMYLKPVTYCKPCL